jgi:hypothetical protein
VQLEAPELSDVARGLQLGILAVVQGRLEEARAQLDEALGLSTDPGGHPRSTLGYGRSRAFRSHPRGTRSMAGPCVSSQ